MKRGVKDSNLKGAKTWFATVVKLIKNDPKNKFV
jgi:hypothetical protein